MFIDEEMGRGGSSVRSILTVHGMVSLAVQRWEPKSRKTSGLDSMANGSKLGAFAITEDI